MTKRTEAVKIMPEVMDATLAKLGADLRTARLRRRMTQVDMADRIGVTPQTLRRLEEGDPGVGIGVLGTALFVLGLKARLGDLAAPDADRAALIEDLNRLPSRVRPSRKPSHDMDF